MGKTITGTKKVDEIIIQNGNGVITTNGKKSSIKISASEKNYIYGMAKNDKIYIEGSKNDYVYGDDEKGKQSGNDTIVIIGGKSNTVYGGKGKDTIYVENSKNNYIYGDDKEGKLSGNDSITIVGGSGNKIYAGKGNDSISIDGGTKNSFYGGQGKDTFYLTGKKGSATIKDYTKGQDKLTVIDNSIIVTKTKLSGKNNVVFTVGRTSVTLEKVLDKTISMKDNRGSYTVSKSTIKLGKDFTGTMKAATFLKTVKTMDGRSTAKTIDGSTTANEITLIGNANDNVIYTGKAGGTYEGGLGNDTINVSGSGKNSVYGNAGSDTIIIDGGDNNLIYGDDGDDTILAKKVSDYVNNTVNGGNGADTIKVYNQGTYHGDMGNDKISVFSGKYVHVYGDEGADEIEIAKDTDAKIWVDGGGGKDTVTINGGTGNEIKGGDGDDRIEIASLTGNDNTIYGGEGSDSITVNGGTQTVNGEKGNDHIIIDAGDNHVVYGEDGNDIITVNGGNGHTISSGNYSETESNTIEINGGEEFGYGVKVQGGRGQDKLIIMGYKGNADDLGVTADLGYGDDIVEIYGGKHKIELGGGNDSVTISGGNNISITKGDGSYPIDTKDTYIFNREFDDPNLSFDIHMYYSYSEGNIVFNKVASTDVKFGGSLYTYQPPTESALIIDTGNGVVNVYGWYSPGGLASITFSDGVTYNQEEINSIRWNSRS